MKPPILILICLLYASAFSGDGEKNEVNQIAFYYVKDSITPRREFKSDINALHLDTIPFITEKNIISLDWENQRIMLDSFCIKKMKSKMNYAHCHEPFIVTVKGKRIYLGVFWGLLYSSFPRLPFATLYPTLNQTNIGIYPGCSDARKNEDLYAVLKKLDKLLKKKGAHEKSFY
jgi:hypothetical protein